MKYTSKTPFKKQYISYRPSINNTNNEKTFTLQIEDAIGPSGYAGSNIGLKPLLTRKARLIPRLFPHFASHITYQQILLYTMGGR